MSNFIVSYDLNGPRPSHKQVDDLFGTLGAVRARILETVWYVGYRGGHQKLFDAVNSILSPNDRLLVVLAEESTFRNLLVEDAALLAAWVKNH